MNGDWWRQQFGDQDTFAVSISLGRDPHPCGDPEVDGGWGSIALWVKGRCLTRNVSREAGTNDEVRWNLGSILEWLVRVGPRLANEEPFPLRAIRCRDGCDWVDETEDAPQVLDGPGESEWFVTRSEWRNHHSLRFAAQDVAFPNVVFRRLGSSLEVSWDNETWGTTRPGLTFVEQRGAELVDGAHAARVLLQAVREATRVVAERHQLAFWEGLARQAADSRADEHDWRWLVPAQTARTIQTDLRELDAKLREHTRLNADGWFVSHTLETLTLRQFVPSSASELERVLRFVSEASRDPVSDRLRKLVAPTPPPRIKPWLQGYERALEVREELGWGDDPVPELTTWLRDQGVTVDTSGFARAIDLLVLRATRDDVSGWAASMALNPQASSRLRSEIASAAALGHLLMDAEDAGRRAAVAVEGEREDWPSAARARAFGVMLRLPTGGVRRVLQGRSRIDAQQVAKVMEHFDTGPIATTRHLKNLGFIDEEREAEILGELLAA